MQKLGASVGGEQSGHLLFTEFCPTGDGILSALALLSVMRETGETLAALSTCMRKFPQVLVNVPVRRKPDLATLPALGERVRVFESEMGASGRVLLRYSGTEPLARVMVEGPVPERVQVMADELAQLIRDAAGEA